MKEVRRSIISLVVESEKTDLIKTREQIGVFLPPEAEVEDGENE